MSTPSGNQSLNQQQLGNQRNQIHQQMAHQNLYGGSPLRAADSVYQPGMGARQLTWYMHQQRQRPKDNDIEFWRNFVAEFFDLNAKKRWCVSLYRNSHQTSGVTPQDTWNCEICNIKPSSGFETTADLLPRLYQIKYDSGTLEELLYVDMPHEYQNPYGHITLHYAKAIQQCIFEQLHIVCDGQLRIVFTPDLKIDSWEFCARNHEERIPRRIIISQFGQLGEVAQKYEAARQNTSSSIPTDELQSNCNMFVTSARQLAKALEAPLVNDLGYPKRYVRCLQISEVVNCMTDLINYSRENGTGAMESLGKFTKRTSSSSQLHVSGQQTEGQNQLISGENIYNDCNSVPSTSQQQLISRHNPTGNSNSASNNVQTAYDSLGATLTSTSVTATFGLTSKNCANSWNGNLIYYQIKPTRPSTQQCTSLLCPNACSSPPVRSSASDAPQVSQSSLPEATPPPKFISTCSVSAVQSIKRSRPK